jgi:hypothetical protein
MGFIMHRSIGVTLFLIASVLVPRQARAVDPVTAVAAIIGTTSAALDLKDRYDVWTGLVESDSSMIKRNIDKDLLASQSLMEQYNNAPNNKKLLQDARTHFTRAAGGYEGRLDGTAMYKRALSWLGVKLCCDAVDDRSNAQLALFEITKIGMIPGSASVERGPNYLKYLAILDEVYSHLITEGAITRDSVFKKANRLYRGEGGSPQEFEAAFRLMRVAAKQGHREAQAILGEMYLVGRGVPQNGVEGTAWAAVSSMYEARKHNIRISGVTLSPGDEIKVRKRVSELFKKYGKTK